MLQGLWWTSKRTEWFLCTSFFCNVSDEVLNLAAETVVALAKPFIEVTLLELFEENQGSVGDQARVINQQVSHATVKRTIPESLQELLTDLVLKGFHCKICLIYLDDVIAMVAHIRGRSSGWNRYRRYWPGRG